MMLGSSEISGADLLFALPDDVFASISRSLCPRDICNLSMCCRSVYDLASSDKIWLTQCELVGVVSPQDLFEWRNGVLSYKALCRFLVSVQPLFGIWVHQNPELGNVVFVMPGFVSVVGCRIIPQELGPLGINDGPLLWAPVFEIVGDCDGSAAFLLHGREKGDDYVYPGLVKSIDKTCNILLLEVEPSKHNGHGRLIHCKSSVHHSEPLLRKISHSDQGLSMSQRVVVQNAPMVPFSRLAFGDRRKMLELVTSRIGIKVSASAKGPLFLASRGNEKSFEQDLARMIQRRLLLLKIHKVGTDATDWKSGSASLTDPTQLELSEIRKSLDRASGFRSSLNGDNVIAQINKRRTLGGYFRKSIKQILGKSSSIQANQRNGCNGNENKHAQLNEFLRSGDTIGLTIHALKMKLTSYRAWPNMHDSRFALYKLPLPASTPEREYAGVWGGTFGWPPGKPTEDKPGKALFFLLLTYEEVEQQILLTATKILEGTNYVLHPNGSSMFMVDVNEPSYDSFPWNTDADSLPINVERAFAGEGIANGYGFRYPGSKPGSLFVMQDGLLAFVWKESSAVLTLQRMNLEDLLRKGERVPALPPIANFSYLTKSYSNVFTGFANTSSNDDLGYE